MVIFKPTSKVKKCKYILFLCYRIRESNSDVTSIVLYNVVVTFSNFQDWSSMISPKLYRFFECYSTHKGPKYYDSSGTNYKIKQNACV